jgi:hypothetical protein
MARKVPSMCAIRRNTFVCHLRGIHAQTRYDWAKITISSDTARAAAATLRHQTAYETELPSIHPVPSL